MMSKREAVRTILEGKGADRIPIIMNAFSLPVVRYGYTMPEVMMSPDDRFDLVLKESGDAWHISDTQTKKVKEEYGDKVALMGNIPCCSVLMEGTEKEVYEYAYQECMDGAKDGRFILSGDCDVSPLTSDENVIAVVRAAKDAEKVLFG